MDSIKLYQPYRHHTGRVYYPQAVVNEGSSDQEKFPTLVVYTDSRKMVHWARPIEQFLDRKKFVPLTCYPPIVALVEPESTFQSRVKEWVLACFGKKIAADKVERSHRFYEEATELVQARGMTREDAHVLVDYVYDRPVGEVAQEVGGVMITLAAMCNTDDINFAEQGEVELKRVWAKVEQIRAKQAAKPKNSPLPSSINAPQQHAQAALSDVEDPITVPRGLIGAACSAIDKKRDAPKVLAELRRYTTGDLSSQQPAAAPADSRAAQAQPVADAAQGDALSQQAFDDGKRHAHEQACVVTHRLMAERDDSFANGRAAGIEEAAKVAESLLTYPDDRAGVDEELNLAIEAIRALAAKPAEGDPNVISA